MEDSEQAAGASAADVDEPQAPAPAEQEAAPDGEQAPAAGDGTAADEGGEAAEGGEGGEGEEGEAEPPAPPPPKYIKRIITVPKVVKKLTVAMGCLPEELSSCSAFYFILARPGRVPADEMDAALEFGLLTEGPSLRILEQVGSGSFRWTGRVSEGPDPVNWVAVARVPLWCKAGRKCGDPAAEPLSTHSHKFGI